MKKTIFLAAMICLLVGCGEKRSTLRPNMQSNEGLKVDVKSEHGLSIRPYSEKPLIVRVVPDKSVIIASVASFIAVVATVFAAFGAWKAARNTELAAEGQLFLILMHEYDSNEIQDDIRTLKDMTVEWKIIESPFDDIGVAALSANEGGRIKLYHRVSRHFFKAMLLCESKHISETCLKNIYGSVDKKIWDALKYLGYLSILDNIYDVDGDEAEKKDKIKKEADKLWAKIDKMKKIANE